MQQVLVTGATGFLGQHLVRHLLSGGARVTVLARNASLASKSILDGLETAGAVVTTFSHHDEVREVAAGLSPDTTFHLATKYLKSHSEEDVAALIDANIAFGAQLLEGLSGGGGVVVSTMSFFQYLHNEPTAYSLYSATKQAFSDISRYYRDVRELDLREVVLYDTFGPGDTRNKLVPRLIESLLMNTHMEMGPEAQELNLLYIDDVVAGLLAAAGTRSDPVMAVKASANITVGNLVAELESVVGRKLNKSFSNDVEVNELVTEAGAWPAPTDWKPQAAFATALNSTYDWYRRSNLAKPEN